MNAMVHIGPGQVRMEDKPIPELCQAGDALVRIRYAGIADLDLERLRGPVLGGGPGVTLGHEGVGLVERVGAQVHHFKPGDRVLVSSLTSCGRCRCCRAGLAGQCLDGGRLLGRSLDGTQAEWVRVPQADSSLFAAPAEADLEGLVLLSELLPTAFDGAVRGSALQPGEVLAVLGAGALGLAVVMAAHLQSPAEIWVLDSEPWRLPAAMEAGASRSVEWGPAGVDTLLGGRDPAGAEVVVDTLGSPASLAMAQALVAPGGRLILLGAPHEPAALPLERLWERGVTIRTGPMAGVSIPMLVAMAGRGRIQPGHLISHRFALAEAPAAYACCAEARANGVIKVVLHNP